MTARAIHTTGHKNLVDEGSCYRVTYRHNHTSCDGRNAWRWGSKRCSDGDYRYESCTQPEVYTFSICRATV